MEIPEAVPKFVHYPHNHHFSHILQGESDTAPCQCYNTSYKAELRQTHLTPYLVGRSKPGLFICRYPLSTERSVDFLVNHGTCDCINHRRRPMTIASTSAQGRGPVQSYRLISLLHLRDWNFGNCAIGIGAKGAYGALHTNRQNQPNI